MTTQTIKEETNMAKKSSWLLVGLFVMSVGLLCSVTQAMAETLSYKFLLPVTQRQGVQIGDVGSHWVGMVVREGSVALGTGDMAWVKGVLTFDAIKGGGPFIHYSTLTFQDGSTIMTHTKGISNEHSASGLHENKSTGEIIKGTGRFEGIKGTVSSWSRSMPVEKGELGEKVLGEGTLTYTLPQK
jgi:hypothetical protein